MAALGKTERLQNHLKWVLKNSSLPWETRKDVGLWYAEYFQKKDDAERALNVLAGFYGQAPDMAARAVMEHGYLKTVRELDDTQLLELSKGVTAENQWRFPYVMVGFERGVREASDEDRWSVVWRSLRIWQQIRLAILLRLRASLPILRQVWPAAYRSGSGLAAHRSVCQGGRENPAGCRSCPVASGAGRRGHRSAGYQYRNFGVGQASCRTPRTLFRGGRPAACEGLQEIVRRCGCW